jgi:hypothetical protein
VWLSAKVLASVGVGAILVAAVAVSFMLVGANAAAVEAHTPSSAATASAVAATVPPATIAGAGAPSTTLSLVASDTTATVVTVAEGYLEVEFEAVYRTMVELTQEAQVVVRGQVTAVGYGELNGAAESRVTLRVDKCLKGDVGPGREITIFEPGGIVTRASLLDGKFGSPTKEDYEAKQAVLVDGAPLTRVGDACVYFLDADDLHQAVGAGYCPIGAFQGRFIIVDGRAERFVPASPAALGAGYGSLAMDAGAIDGVIAVAASG